MRMILLAILLLVLPVAQAQEVATESFVTGDGTFRFDYPADWPVQQRPDGSIAINTGAFSIVITPPALMDALGLTTEDTTKETLISRIAESFDERFSFEASQPVEGHDALRADFAATTLPDITAAFILVLDIDDQLAMVLATSAELTTTELEAQVMKMAESFEIGEFARPADPTGSLPILSDYATGDMQNEWIPAIAELEALGLIPEGGELIYAQNLLISAMQPGLSIDPNSASASADFVVGGRISLRPQEGTPLAICGLVSRSTGPASEALSDFLIVGPTSDGRIIAMENDASADQRYFVARETPVNFHDPQHVLYIAQGGRLTLFINGIALIEDWPLSLPTESDEALYQTLYAGVNLDPGCVMTSVWVYGLPAAE